MSSTDFSPDEAHTSSAAPGRRGSELGRRGRKVPRPLLVWLRDNRPDIEEPLAAIAAGRVRVDRVARTNPAFPVRTGAAVAVAASVTLRGEAKLRAALEAFGVPVNGRVALDVGAAAGGFTRVLLGAGARRVYAVDVGHGQLLGSLRQDARVVNLEATNIASLTRRLVPDAIEVVTLDVSYLSLASAAAQLAPLAFAPGADLIGLVKPMFELRLGAPPEDASQLARALALAVAGVEEARWRVLATTESPVRGGRGARELLLHARRLPSTAIDAAAHRESVRQARPRRTPRRSLVGRDVPSGPLSLRATYHRGRTRRAPPPCSVPGAPAGRRPGTAERSAGRAPAVGQRGTAPAPAAQHRPKHRRTPAESREGVASMEAERRRGHPRCGAPESGSSQALATPRTTRPPEGTGREDGRGARTARRR